MNRLSLEIIVIIVTKIAILIVIVVFFFEFVFIVFFFITVSLDIRILIQLQEVLRVNVFFKSASDSVFIEAPGDLKNRVAQDIKWYFQIQFSEVICFMHFSLNKIVSLINIYFLLLLDQIEYIFD